MQQICVSISAGNTVSKLKSEQNLQNVTRYPDADVNKFLKGWNFKCNLLCLLNLYNRYWNQVHTKHENLFSILVSKQKQARGEMQLEVFIYLFRVFIFNFEALFVCVKEYV